MQLETMVKELEQDKEQAWDRKVKAQDLGIFANEGLHLTLFKDGDSLEIMEQAHEQIADKLQIPRRYYNRMLQERLPLLLENIRTWLYSEPQREFFIRGVGSTMRAFLSPRYRVINHLEVLEAITSSSSLTAKNVEGSVGFLDSRRMYLNVVCEEMTGEALQGDNIQAGFLLTNSETGHSAFSIQPRIFRVVCLNGMVVPIRTGVRRRFVHLGKEKKFSEVDEMIASTIDTFSNLEYGIKKAAENRLRAGRALIRQMSKGYQLSKPQREAVEQAYEHEDNTLWGVLNAITQTGRDQENYNERVRLEQIAGEVLISSGMLN